jgi:beta-galactosidase
MGAAIAGFQVDMGCPTIAAARCEDRSSDWYQWITTSRIVSNPVLFMSGDAPTKGPGFYELYQQDLDRAQKELGSNALRLSIEWSRIFPTPTFKAKTFAELTALASPDGLSYYHAIFAAMKARGLHPMVTVNHYSLPLWIHDGNACNQNFDTCTAKGWAAPDVIVPEIAKYAGFVAKEFGKEVDVWATENETFSAVVLPSYLIPSSTRVNPPGLYLKTDVAKAATVAMIEAHARMYDAIHANDAVDADGDGHAATVGLVYSVEAVTPLTNNAQDAKTADNMRYFMNDLFLQGVAKGILDRNWDGKTETHPELQNRLDWLGVNYYARVRAQTNVIPTPLQLVTPYFTFNPLNMQPDMNDPSGMYDVLKDVQKWGVPIIITETGVDQATDPALGASWIAKTSQYLARAKSEGVDVRGYFTWSLTDNYEWNHGTKMKFGMYAVDVDKADKPRTPRPAVEAFAQIAKNKGVVPNGLAALFPIQ